MNSVSNIAVGSQNPIKIQAALAGFRSMFPDQEFTGAGYDVASGVGEQPMSCDETLRGAINRAEALRSLAPEADFFVGIEGGIEFFGSRLFANAWIAIIDAAGTIGMARSGSFALPPKVRDLIESGIELGHANDEVFKEHNSKQHGGAVGSLTDGVITRQSLYEHAMALALISFKKPDLFG